MVRRFRCLEWGLFPLDRFLAKASTCIYLLSVCHSSFCSNGPAPTGRVIEASLGTMPTISARRLTSLSRRAIGLVECSFFRCCPGKVIQTGTSCLPVSMSTASFGHLGRSRSATSRHISPANARPGRSKAWRSAATATLCRPREAWAQGVALQCTRQRCQDASQTRPWRS